MKINRNEFERVYNPKLNSGNSQIKKDTATTSNSDKIELSSSAKEYTIIKGFIVAAAKEASQSTSAEKLLELKNSMKSNSYKVLPDVISGAIIK